MPPVDTLIATYRIRCAADEVERIARFIAYEQTVELPQAQVKDRFLLDQIVGKVLSIESDRDGAHRVQIAFNAELASAQLGQLINLVYGNVSMYPGIRLQALQLPSTLLAAFAGPRYGIAGIRDLVGVHGRPLLATAIKPRGLKIEQLAKLAHDFALGGGDIVKDDQNLVDADFERFKLRVDACADAVSRANDSTGRGTLYFPHLAAAHGELPRYAEFVRQRGLRGVLMCPGILGHDTARDLAARFDLIYMAHPSMSGALTQSPDHGIAHDLALGTLLRLGGADICVFVAPGGRFAYTREQSTAIAHACTEELGQLAPTWPCPAGGMGFELLGDLCTTYGTDSVLLIGGSLQAHDPDMVRATRSFLDEIRCHSNERLDSPRTGQPSSCEFDPQSSLRAIVPHLRFSSDWNWEFRDSVEYKPSFERSVSAVRRVELIGKHGERADFDLRYFEVAPGGHTSLEKHLHTHVIIAARGLGEIQIDSEVRDLSPMDIAYVQPLATHQLRCVGDEPFGFFCVVDRERDRPVVV